MAQQRICGKIGLARYRQTRSREHTGFTGRRNSGRPRVCRAVRCSDMTLSNRHTFAEHCNDTHQASNKFTGDFYIPPANFMIHPLLLCFDNLPNCVQYTRAFTTHDIENTTKLIKPSSSTSKHTSGIDPHSDS